MTRIRCRERHCTFNKSGICASEEIEYEPDAGCLTMELRDDLEEDEAWEEEELEEDLYEEDEDEDADWDDEDWEEDEDTFSTRRRRR